MIVTVPLVLLLIDFWPFHRFDTTGRNLPLVKIVKNLLAEKMPFFLFSVVVGSITFFAQREGGATTSGPPLGIASRMGEAVVGYLGYLEKLVWPHNLACLYLRPSHVNPGTLVVAVIILSGNFVLAATHLRRRPYLMMGWLWFVVMLLPVSGVIQFGLQSIADRYTYLPSIGFYVMCVWVAAELAETLFPPAVRRFLPGAAAAAILAAFALLSRHQLGYWRNTQTLMEHAIKIDPNNYVAHDDLGIYFSKIGRIQDALVQFKLERELDPDTTHPPGTSDRSSPTRTGSK